MLLTTLALTMAAVGQGPADWYEPFPAHKIVANVCYVGSKDLASFLITTPEGHILINSGFERTVPLIQKSVESLGFKMSDVKILLASHAHSDHVAGHALLQRLTGAKVFVMRGDDQVIASGGKGQYLYTTSRWEPCKVDRVLEDGDEVKLGGVTLVARLTPGHTRGCTTWTWRVEDGGNKYDVVVIGSPNVNPGYKLVNNKDYPEIAADFTKTFAVLKSLPCDVFLGAHGNYYGMVERYELLRKGQTNAFVNPEGYKEYVAQKERAFRKTLSAQQRNAEKAGPPVVSAISERLRQYVAAKEIAGAVTLVATPHQVLHLEATGNAALNPPEAMRTDSIFWIASMSKPVLATLLLMLQDEGLLSVDDPVEKYLPEFKELKTVDGIPARVTIRHLLTHTSGMGEISPNEARRCKTLADVIPLYIAKPVRFMPGSKWVYCQSGINTGGRIAEVVTGEPLDKLLQRRLFEPLGMKDTTFYLTEEQLSRLAKSYRRTDQGNLEAAAIGFLNGKSPTSRDRFPAPNGGLFSTASDYARFCQMVLRGGELDGKRYLKPETVKLMTTIQTGDLKTGFTEGNGWGLGWCVVREPQGITAMLSPGTFGHGGVYGTQAWIDPKLQKIYILMVQRANFPNSDASEVRRGFQEAASAALGHATRPPQAEIDNGLLKVQFYLPDAQSGFYRGTRFDWSGVIGSLEYKGHRYYGPWFTKTDPTVNDFIYQGADIVAGPCSAITGPVEEFSTDDKALGYEEAKPGGTFIKIGVGVLRKPQEGGRYNRFRLYEIVDPGTWRVQTTRTGITFTHDVADPSSGYGYRYEKRIQLVPGRPEMVMDHKLMNTGKRAFTSSVYNHNFLVLDGQPSGPDFVLQLPFEIKTRAANNALAAVRGNQIVYRKTLRDKETVFLPMQGFGPTAEDYRFTIENQKTGAGLKITGNRPLSNVVLWSIRSVLSLEPFLTMSIELGQEFTWKYTYTYYVIDGK